MHKIQGLLLRKAQVMYHLNHGEVLNRIRVCISQGKGTGWCEHGQVGCLGTHPHQGCTWRHAWGSQVTGH